MKQSTTVKTVEATFIQDDGMREQVHRAVMALLDGHPCNPRVIQWLNARLRLVQAQQRAEWLAQQMKGTNQ